MKAAIDASLSWFGNLFNSAGLGSVKAAACGGFADLGERPREEEKEEGEDDKNWAIYFAEERALADARSSARNVGKALSRITSYSIDTAFDYMQRVQSGMYKSRLITHELITKTYNIQTLNYADEFSKHNHLNPHPMSTLGLPSKSFSFLAVEPRALETYNNFKSDGMKNWYLQNIMQMNEINAYTMDMTVPGRSDLTVGDIIDVYIYRNTPMTQKDTEEQLLDKTFSGRYLITSLCHTLNREKHEIHMTVIKDSLIIDLAKEGTK